MPGDYSRIHRLLRLLMLMQQAGAGNAKQLADQLGVVERTIYRDLEVLTDLGIPYHFDEQAGGYRVGKDFFLPPVHLTTSETLALLALGNNIANDEQIAMTGPAKLALEKIRTQLPPAVLKELGDLDQYVDIKLPATGPAGDAIEDIFSTVQHAIHQRRTLQCKYESLNGDANRDAFEFHPYCLSFDQRAWYAIGHHTRHNEIRRLKLSRFTQAHVTDKPYAIPDDFSPDKFRGQAWRMIRGDQLYDIAIHFDATVADTVADTNWHRTQAIDFHDDSSITYHCQVEGLDEIVWWILSYGPHAHVIKPDALADRVAELIKATAERYAQPWPKEAPPQATGKG